jgi:hypothetical protein
MTHSTAKRASFGPHYTSTRDDLVHVERAGQHVETEKQSRFGLLADAYCPKKSGSGGGIGGGERGGFINRSPGRRQGTILVPTAARHCCPAADLVGLRTFWNEGATSGSREPRGT